MKKLLLLLLLSLGLIGISYAGDSQEAVERKIACKRTGERSDTYANI